MKRLSVLLAVLIILNIVPELASAYGNSSADWRYIRIENGYEIDGYEGPDVEHLVIPDTYEGLPVVGLGFRALAACEMTSVTIPQSVQYISERAFEACFSLTSVTIPKNVVSISEGSLMRCEKLVSIIVEQGNPNYLVANRSLIDKNSRAIIAYPAGLTEKDYKIPEGIVRIGESAFAACNNLISVTIPDSVTTIGEDAFWDCNSLETAALPEKLTIIEGHAFQQCHSLTSVVIPHTVTHIGEMAFDFCSRLKSINIPAKVQNIGQGAFAYCEGLTSISVEQGNEKYSVMEHALVSNEDMKLITFPSGLEIWDYAIAQGVKIIGEHAFRGSASIEELTIPISVESIEQSAFAGANIASVHIPDSVTSIGKEVFDTSGVSQVRLPQGLSTIKERTFWNCNDLGTISFIPDSVTSIGEEAFGACNGLTSISIPSGVTSIGPGAFYWCSGLTSAFIPSSVKDIGEDAFASCSPSFKILGVEESFAQEYAENSNIPFEAVYTKDMVPAGLNIDIKNQEGIITGYNGSFDVLVIPSAVGRVPVTALGDWAFYWNEQLKDITFPDTLTSIGSLAMAGCSSLRSVFLPESISKIADDAFAYCADSLVLVVQEGSYAAQWAKDRGIQYRYTLTSLKTVDVAVKSGDFITLGHYEQDNNISNGKESIKWRVLEVNDKNALLISEKNLDAYNRWLHVNEGEFTWETWTVRNWLNNDFMETAFTSEERACIVPTNLRNPDNPVYGTTGGLDTQDRVFLLNLTEADVFFDSDPARKARNTPYAEAQGVLEFYTFGWWWLRTPGMAADIMTSVGNDGSIWPGGGYGSDGCGAIRPAIYIDLSTGLFPKVTSEWYVDPNSISSSQVMQQAVPLVTATSQPSDSAAISDTVLFYNQDGGQYYHLDPNCSSIAERYKPLTTMFYYRDVSSDSFKFLLPCPICEATAR